MTTEQYEESHQRAAAPAGRSHNPRWWARGRSHDLSSRGAVPARADRRELRRRLRGTVRSERAERERVTAHQLERLPAWRPEVVGLQAGPTADTRVLTVAGGLSFLLLARDASTAFGRLERRIPKGGVYIDGVRSALGRSWYRLDFDVPGGREQLTARVVIAPQAAEPEGNGEHHNRQLDSEKVSR